jgi:hypothetical protein
MTVRKMAVNVTLLNLVFCGTTALINIKEVRMMDRKNPGIIPLVMAFLIE